MPRLAAQLRTSLTVVENSKETQVCRVPVYTQANPSVLTLFVIFSEHHSIIYRFVRLTLFGRC